MRHRLVIVGNPEKTHVGAHFLRAAGQLDIDARLCDSRTAFEGPDWSRRLNWWLRGRRPPRLEGFSAEVVKSCREFKPSFLLTTGIAPIDRKALDEIGRLGVKRLNYLTDDPWNPAHLAPWFLETLDGYNQVFTPRRVNVEDLRRAGCRRVTYLPFAYDPDIHRPPDRPNQDDKSLADIDVVFVGGADRDRKPYIEACIKDGLIVGVWGGYWDRYKAMRPYAHGFADPETMRRAIAYGKVSLCLVRRANRDGHVMRSFEIPAIGGCLLAEDTDEHRELFGEDGEAACYFRGENDLVDKVRLLLRDDNMRQRLAHNARQQIVGGKNTYMDRLKMMLKDVTG